MVSDILQIAVEVIGRSGRFGEIAVLGGGERNDAVVLHLVRGDYLQE